jgi:hypothetical protein
MRYLLPLLLVASCWAQQLPDSALTPGAIVPMSREKLCSTAWGKDERKVTQKMKLQVCAAYHAKDCPGPFWEVDHLVSRELAGADSIENLWPQPAPDFHWKDRLENRLHKEVCAGNLKLADAQEMIRTDWYATYLKYFPKPQ